MNFDQFPPFFWKQLHLKPFAFNHRAYFLPNLWGIYSESLNPTIISSSQLVSFSIDKVVRMVRPYSLQQFMLVHPIPLGDSYGLI